MKSIRCSYEEKKFIRIGFKIKKNLSNASDKLKKMFLKKYYENVFFEKIKICFFILFFFQPK